LKGFKISLEESEAIDSLATNFSITLFLWVHSYTLFSKGG